MKVYCLVLMAFLSVNAMGQAPDTRELLRQLSTSKKDTAAVRLLMQLGYSRAASSPDSAVKYMEQAMNLAKEIGDKPDEMQSMGEVASYWWSVGDYATASRLYLVVRNYYESVHSADLSMINSTLLNTYRDQGDYQEALKYSNYNIKLVADTDFAIGMVNAMAGSVYYEMGKMDSANYFLTRSLHYPLNLGPGWIFMMNGRVKAKLDSLPEGLRFYRRAIAELLKEKNYKDLAETYTSIGELYLKTGLIDSAVYYGKLGLDLGRSWNFRKEIIQSYQLLSAAYEKKDIRISLDYFKKGAAIRDSLYSQDKQRELMSYKFNEQLRQTELKNLRKETASRNSIYFLVAVLIAVLLVSVFLIRNNRRKQRVNRLLKSQNDKVESTLAELKITQAQLIQAEKMASLGEVTAGIAHEIQNPLNFVNNFSELNAELITEMTTAIDSGNNAELQVIAADIAANSERIHQHGKRAEAIVKGMLTYSRKTAGEKEWVDINDLCRESLQLSYQSFRIQHPDLNIEISSSYAEGLEKVSVHPTDFGRVLLNLFNNAFYELARKVGKSQPAKPFFSPSVLVKTAAVGNEIGITIQDNGDGIPAGVVDKIFQPFFTTKPAGDGTGLGLSLVYDIVTKGHGGTVTVGKTEGTGTTFTIKIPKVLRSI